MINWIALLIAAACIGYAFVERQLIETERGQVRASEALFG